MELPQNFELDIVKMAHQGFGMGYYQNIVVFVPYTIPGDRVVVEVEKIKKNFVVARLKRVVRPSDFRVKPDCPYFGRCGGCHFRHIDYNHQLQLKGQVIKELFNRIAGLDIEPSALVPSPELKGYRIRGRFHIDPESGLPGFKKMNSNDVIGIEFCPVYQEDTNRFLAFYPQLNLRGINQVQIVESKNEILLHFMGRPVIKNKRQIFNVLEKNVVIYINSKPITKRQFIELDMPYGPSVRFRPGMFVQTNPFINQLIMDYVRDVVKQLNTGFILELHAGVGNFTFALKDLIDIDAIESSKTAVLEFTRRKNISDVKINIFHGDSVRVMQQLDLTKYQGVLVDPPRTGLKPEEVELIDSFAFILIYVSCEPSTLARDVKRLIEKGWSFISLRTFDMFPFTFHAENVVVLTKAKIY